MRRFTAAVATVFAAIGCTFTEPTSTTDAPEPAVGTPLAGFVNLELRELDDNQHAELDRILSASLPNGYRPEDPSGFCPLHLWRDDSSPATPRYILFQGLRFLEIPARARVAVHFFDTAGRLVDTVEFSVGYRIQLISAALMHDPELGGQVIDVRSKPVIGGQDVCRQVYGLVDRRLVTLRLGDSEGRAVQNDYANPSRTFGPKVPTRTAEEWERALASKQHMVVLEALGWLAGDHRQDQASQHQRDSKEDPDEDKLVGEVRARPKVQQAVKELCRSDIEWIRQAAKLALKRFPK